VVYNCFSFCFFATFLQPYKLICFIHVLSFLSILCPFQGKLFISSLFLYNFNVYSSTSYITRHIYNFNNCLIHTFVLFYTNIYFDYADFIKSKYCFQANVQIKTHSFKRSIFYNIFS